MIKGGTKISAYIKNKSVINLAYLHEEWLGQILAHSKHFILLREVRDFAFDGFIIFNKKYIKQIQYNKQEKFDELVVKKYNKPLKTAPKWLDLKSFNTLLGSLKKNYNKFCIDTTDDEDNFFVGKIINFNDNSMHIKGMDTFANFEDKLVKIKHENIGYISFKDNYSTMLFKYNKES